MFVQHASRLAGTFLFFTTAHCLVALAGCGRLGFESSAGGEVTGDGSLRVVEDANLATDGRVHSDAETPDSGACLLTCLENQRLLDLNPIVYYRLNEVSGTSIADSSGNNKDAILNPDGNLVRFNEPNDAHCSGDSAMRFLGNHRARVADVDEGAYIERNKALLPKMGSEPRAFSVSLWYRFTSEEVATGAFPNRSRVFTIGQSNSDQIGYYHDGYNGYAPESWNQRESQGSGDFRPLRYSFTPAPDTWHHVALTSDGSILRTYFDGVPTVTGPAWPWNGATWDSTTITIAANGFEYSDRYSGRFNGWVDEFAVFNQQISADDVMRIYQEATQLLCPGS